MILFIVTFMVVTMSSCNNQDQGHSSGFEAQTNLPDDFIEFYERFHSDTAYQIDHIAFPLQGMRAFSSIDSSVDNSTWTMKDWIFHSAIDNLGGEYTIEYTLLTDEMITETISDTMGMNAMQRRFALTSDGWQLIYYVEMQPATRRKR